jgi:hypothetical protein
MRSIGLVVALPTLAMIAWFKDPTDDILSVVEDC